MNRTHQHKFILGKSGKIETCSCGRWRHANYKQEDVIVAQVDPVTNLKDAMRDVLNGLYALRDNARLMDGEDAGDLEQKLIEIGASALAKFEESTIQTSPKA